MLLPTTTERHEVAVKKTNDPEIASNYKFSLAALILGTTPVVVFGLSVYLSSVPMPNKQASPQTGRHGRSLLRGQSFALPLQVDTY